MAQDIKYYKLSSLPSVPERGAIYFIPNGIGSDVDQYIVDKDGTAFIFVGRTNANALTISAGVLSGTAGQLNFGNANGVTFGYNPFISQITASINPSPSGLSAGMSNIGNTAGNTGTVTNRLILAGGNNITLSQITGAAGNTIYFSANAGGAGGNVSIQGSTGNISFDNSNGITFGGNNSTITASYTVPTDYISTQLSTLFQHTSLMSNYLDTSYTSHTHSQYLSTDYTSHSHTEYQQSSLMTDYLGTTYTSHTHSQYASISQTTLFQQTSQMTDYLQTSYTTHTHDYLGTTYTTHTHSQYLNTSQSSLFQQTSQMSDYLGTAYTTHTHPSLIFVGGIAASNTTYTSGTISLRDGNGISFATTTGQGISINHSLQQLSNTSAITSNALNTSQSSLFQHTSATSAITSNALNTSQSSLFQHTSATSAITSNAFNTSGSSNFVLTANSSLFRHTSQNSQLQFTSQMSDYLGTAQSSKYIQNWKLTGNTAGTTSSAQGTDLWLAGGNGVTISGSSNTLSFSVATNYQSQGAYLTTAGLSQDSSKYAGTGTTFNGANISASYTLNSNGLQASMSVAAPGAAAENNWYNLLGANTAGNTTASGSTIGLSGINVTLSGTNNSVIVISGPPNITRSGFDPYAEINFMLNTNQSSIMINPIDIPNVQFDRIVMPIFVTNASNSSGSQTVSLDFGIYTRNGSSISLSTSASTSYGLTQSGNAAGNALLYLNLRLWTIGMTHTLTEGQYWVGIVTATASAAANASISQAYITQLGSNFFGMFNASSSASNQYRLGQGKYSANAATLPNVIAFTDIQGTPSQLLRQPVFYFASSTI